MCDNLEEQKNNIQKRIKQKKQNVITLMTVKKSS